MSHYDKFRVNNNLFHYHESVPSVLLMIHVCTIIFGSGDRAIAAVKSINRGLPDVIYSPS